MRKRGTVHKLATYTNKVRAMVMKALNLGTPNLKDVAREAGISYHAVRAYKRGHRVPSPQVCHQLAEALRRFADGMRLAADDLDTVRVWRKP